MLQSLYLIRVVDLPLYKYWLYYIELAPSIWFPIWAWLLWIEAALSDAKAVLLGLAVALSLVLPSSLIPMHSRSCAAGVRVTHCASLSPLRRSSLARKSFATPKSSSRRMWAPFFFPDSVVVCAALFVVVPSSAWLPLLRSRPAAIPASRRFLPRSWLGLYFVASLFSRAKTMILLVFTSLVRKKIRCRMLPPRTGAY
jgi:hypothetical protein